MLSLAVSEAHEVPQNFHAVSVIARNTIKCAAVAMIEKKTFLSADAPRLPLEGCDSKPTCQCVYKHHEDRRMGPRRAFELGRPTRAFAPDRRVRGDRRALSE